MDVRDIRYDETVLVVRLPPDLKAALRAQADREKKSMNTVVVTTLGKKLKVPVTQEGRRPPHVVRSDNDTVAA